MPHGFGGGSKEVCAPGKSARLVSGQPQPCFVNQGCGLEGVTRSLPSHFVRGQLAQFLVDQREQFPCGLGIAACIGFENSGYVVDEKYNTIFSCHAPEIAGGGGDAGVPPPACKAGSSAAWARRKARVPTRNHAVPAGANWLPVFL